MSKMKYNLFLQESFVETKKEVKRELVSSCLSETYPDKKNNKKTLKSSKCSILDYHRRYSLLYTAILLMGMILTFQIDRSVIPNSKKTTLGVQHNGYSSFHSIEKITAKLARVMNAIVLQNEWHQESITMKQVMAEALDVQNASLFDHINKTSVLEITQTMKTLHFLAVQATKLNGSITDLNDFVFYKDDTFPKTSIKKMLFNRSIPILNNAERRVRSLNDSLCWYENLTKELRLPLLNYDKIDNSARKYLAHLNSFSKLHNNHLFFESIEYFVNSSESVHSLIYFIEKYQQLTDYTYLKRLIKSLNILLPSATIVDSLLKSSERKNIAEKFDAVNRLISKNVKASDMHALIGFPQKSKDFQNLIDDFNDEILKKMLHEGKSLNELKNILLPVLNFNTKIAGTEKIWTKTARMNYSHLISSSLMTLNIIDALKPMSISNSLSRINATLEKLKPNPDLKNADLNEFKQLLKNLSRISIEWKEFFSLKEKLVKFGGQSWDIMEPEEKVTIEEKIANYKKEFLAGKHVPIYRAIIEKAIALDKQEEHVKNIFFKFTDFEAKFTDETFDYIRKIVERTQIEKIDIKKVQNYIQLLNSLSPLVEIELSAIDKFPDFLFAAKAKLNESPKVEKELKSEIQRTKGYQRLKKFPYARVITIQLACLRRAMAFYQRRDLQQIFDDFVRNGKNLAEKIKSLPHTEKQYICSGFHNLSFLNISMTNFVSEAEKLPSRFHTKKHSLKSFGKLFSYFYRVPIPLIDFDLITSTLYNLKSTSIGRSDEVSDLVQSLEHLEDLEYAAICNKQNIAPLLAEADTFFQEFFLKSNKENWLLLLIVIITFAMLLVFVLVLLFLWHKTINAGKHNSQDREKV